MNAINTDIIVKIGVHVQKILVRLLLKPVRLRRCNKHAERCVFYCVSSHK